MYYNSRFGLLRPRHLIAVALFWLGVLLILLNRDNLESVIDRIFPERAYAKHYAAATALDKDSQYKQAADEYTLMIKIYPNEQFGYALRALDYFRLRKFDKSIADNTKAISLMTVPDQAVYFDRGNAYRETGELQKAVADFSKSLALKPNYYPSLASLGVVQIETHDYVWGIANLTAALAQNPNDVQALRQRGAGYLQLGHTKEALLDYEAALRISPQDVTTLWYMAWEQYAIGDVRAAISYSQSALKLQPRLAQASTNLGLFYAVEGDTAASQEAYKRNLQIAPPSMISGALIDIKDALKHHPNSDALKQAQALMQSVQGVHKG